MAQADIELLHYRPIVDWRPTIGDIIIKHGWLSRTKWFGVVNFIHPEAELDVIIDGTMRLLASTAPAAMRKKCIKLSIGDVAGGSPGSYTVMQHDLRTNAPVWYI